MREIKSFAVFPADCRNAGKMIKCYSLGFSTPCRFIEDIISFIVFSRKFKRKTEIEEAFSVIRIRIAPCLLFDGFLEIGNALFRFAATEEQKAVGIVQPYVGSIAPQSLEIVICRGKGRMAVLLDMLTGEEKLLCRSDITRLCGRRGGLGNRLILGDILFVFAYDCPVSVKDRDFIILQTANIFGESLLGRKVECFFIDKTAA